MHTSLRFFWIVAFVINSLSCFLIQGEPYCSFEEAENSTYIQSLASLLHHVNCQTDQEEKHFSEKSLEPLAISEERAEDFWETIFLFNSKEKEDSFNHKLALVEAARQKYEFSKAFQLCGSENSALEELKECSALLTYLWKGAIEAEITNESDPSFTTIFRSKGDPNLERNRCIKSKIKRKIRPYLIPYNHPMKPILDELFSTRVTANRETLKNANFKIIDRRNRSFIFVVSHTLLPGYLLKLHLDRDKRKKQHKESWEWLVKRCEGAKKIQGIIKKHSIKHFVCAKKWIYCLPPEPSPPKDKNYTRHLAVLLVTDMQLIPSEENYHAWRYRITKNHLDELYVLVTRGKGSSYRPDNMPFTKDGKIAFIDTEYPNKGPDFNSIRGYLNSEMRRYWDKIVSAGGP